MIVDPQVVANGYLAPHPDHELARLASSPCSSTGKASKCARGAPDVGEHTDQVLGELGLDADEIAHLHSIGAVA